MTKYVKSEPCRPSGCRRRSHATHIQLWEEPELCTFSAAALAVSALLGPQARNGTTQYPLANAGRANGRHPRRDGRGRSVTRNLARRGPLLFAASQTAFSSCSNSYARLAWAADYPWGTHPEERDRLLQAIEEGWGTGVAFEALVSSQAANVPMRNWWARYQRLAASPGAAVTLLRSAFDTDARHVLRAIKVPVLLLHRTGDPFTSTDHGRYLAQHIAGSKYVELAGVDHLFFSEDTERLLAEIQEFLTGVREETEPERVLATVLFTDIVASTERAAEEGDRQWRDLLEGFYASLRDELTRFRGREIDTAGDGLFASFDGPARAIRCAHAIRDAVRTLGIEIRAGLHTGECEVIGDKLGGIAVHMGARVAAMARPGEVLV